MWLFTIEDDMLSEGVSTMDRDRTSTRWQMPLITVGLTLGLALGFSLWFWANTRAEAGWLSSLDLSSMGESPVARVAVPRAESSSQPGPSFIFDRQVLTQTVHLPLIFKHFPPFFKDDFSSDLGWEPMLESGSDAGLVDGEYFLKHTVALKIVRSIAPPCAQSNIGCEAPIPSAYGVEVEAHFVQGDVAINRYGIVFEQVDVTKQYIFVINPDTQTFWVYKFDPQKGFIELEAGTSADILTGNETNRLKVERDGDAIRVYANGALLGETTDSTYKGGQVGLDVWRFEDSTVPTEARFDNFTIYSLP
jgi:hypothetical protein